jgi:hypothetical protein
MRLGSLFRLASKPVANRLTRNFYSASENQAVAINRLSPGVISTCFFSYMGYHYMGGKELIEAKINNLKADSELKISQANHISKGNKP